ncbi:hypothetical protein XSR1_50108 [Xenorhabdus szentirmaii DSM 16338]|uniref:Uncharacterized protein n=1 Tax=Xenorhabdus szentirmaii DSM 16338 TaxID=1427518 RepID=W1J4C1_9GAMM|nr:hypothetical protein XSR1_50108 [Xenorhabdus szentirmaii DSM 16338]
MQLIMKRAQFIPEVNYHVIAVSGLGDLFLYGENTGMHTSIHNNYNIISREEDGAMKKTN